MSGIKAYREWKYHDEPTVIVAWTDGFVKIMKNNATGLFSILSERGVWRGGFDSQEDAQQYLNENYSAF